MVKLYKFGGVYYVYSYVNGQRRRWSLRTRDRVVAETLRRQTELDLLAGSPVHAKPWKDFQTEFLEWIAPQIRPSTMRGYRFVIGKFGTFLESQNISALRDIGPGTVSRFTESRKRELHPSRKRPMTEGGIKFDLRIMHRVFGYAIECEYMSKNPVIARNINSTPGKTIPFNQREIDAMLADADVIKKPYLRALILIFLHTGLRIGDVIELKRTAITGDRLLIRTRKRNRDVTLHIHEELAEAFKVHFAAQDSKQKHSPLVFSTDSGKPLKNMDKHLYRIFRRAGIAGGHAHRFRDTFAVRLLAKGASLYDVAKLLGISVQTAERHYTPYVEELKQRATELVKRLDFVERLP